MGIEHTQLEPIVRRALAEDVGSGDLTTQATVPVGAQARARITQKQPGVLYGLDAAQLAFALLDPGARFLSSPRRACGAPAAPCSTSRARRPRCSAPSAPR